jgi:hypothetical protein
LLLLLLPATRMMNTYGFPFPLSTKRSRFDYPWFKAYAYMYGVIVVSLLSPLGVEVTLSIFITSWVSVWVREVSVKSGEFFPSS